MFRPEKRARAKRRLANVAFGEAFLDRELAYRNARKHEQENTARGLIVASGALMTVLLALGKDADVYGANVPWVVRAFLVLTLTAAVLSAVCGAITQWPRRYDRFGAEAFDHFNDAEFLDCAEDVVIGRTLGGRITVAKTMDKRHEDKARWLRASFVCFLVALGGLVGQGVTLAVDPFPSKSSSAGRIVICATHVDPPSSSAAQSRCRP